MFRSLTWRIETQKPEVFLTFDDGPIEDLTPWVLDVLKEKGVKATFFVVGENAERNPHLVSRILKEGHSLGNHTHNHISGFKSKTKTYLDNVERCHQVLKPHLKQVDNRLFRPPYGRILPNQYGKLRREGYITIMWDVLSLDFETKVSPEKCLDNVLKHSQPGSIIVFHDNLKAEKNLRFALPRAIDGLLEMGFSFSPIRF